MCFSNLQLAPTVLTAWAACQRVGTVRMAMCVTRWTGHVPKDASLGLSLRILFVMKVSRTALTVLARVTISDELCKVASEQFLFFTLPHLIIMLFFFFLSFFCVCVCMQRARR